MLLCLKDKMSQQDKLFQVHCFVQHMANLTMVGYTNEERITKLRFNWGSGVIRALYPPRVSIIKDIKPRETKTFIETWKIEDEDFNKRLTEVLYEIGGWPKYDISGDLVVDPLTENEKDLLSCYLMSSLTSSNAEITLQYIEDIGKIISKTPLTSQQISSYWETGILTSVAVTVSIFSDNPSKQVEDFEKKYNIKAAAIVSRLVEMITKLNGWPVRVDGKVTVLKLSPKQQQVCYEHARRSSSIMIDKMMKGLNELSQTEVLVDIKAGDLLLRSRRISSWISDIGEMEIQQYFGPEVLFAIKGYQRSLDVMYKVIDESKDGPDLELIKPIVNNARSTMATVVSVVLSRPASAALKVRITQAADLLR